MSHSLPSIRFMLLADEFIFFRTLIRCSQCCLQKTRRERKRKKLYVCITTIIRNIYMA